MFYSRISKRLKTSEHKQMYPNIHNVTKHRSAFLHGYYTKRLIKSKFYTKTLKVSEEIRKLWQETKKLKLENFRYWKTGETEKGKPSQPRGLPQAPEGVRDKAEHQSSLQSALQPTLKWRQKSRDKGLQNCILESCHRGPSHSQTHRIRGQSGGSLMPDREEERGNYWSTGIKFQRCKTS